MEYQNKMTIWMTQSRYCEIAKISMKNLEKKIEWQKYKESNAEMLKRRAREYNACRLPQPRVTCQCGANIVQSYVKLHMKLPTHFRRIKESQV